MSLLLAHLSDTHIGPLPRPRFHELLGKRLTGYLNWTRGRHLIHDMDGLNRLVADLKAQRPGHIAMTGDILNIGLKAEFPPARSWLETLGSPDDVSFVPGNHDAYVRSSLPYLATTFAAWTAERFRRAGLSLSAGARGGGDHRPLLRRADGAADRLRPGGASPTRRRRRIARADRPRRADSRRADPPSAASKRRKIRPRLADAAQFEAMIRRQGAELVLHGHNHRLSVTHIPGPGRQVPVIGVASASATQGTHDHRASYNLFRIEGSQKTPRISGHMRGLLPGGREFGELRPIVL